MYASLVLVRPYQYGGADCPPGFPSNRDSLWVTAKGLDVFLHPPEGCQLIQ